MELTETVRQQARLQMARHSNARGKPVWNRQNFSAAATPTISSSVSATQSPQVPLGIICAIYESYSRIDYFLGQPLSSQMFQFDPSAERKGLGTRRLTPHPLQKRKTQRTRHP